MNKGPKSCPFRTTDFTVVEGLNKSNHMIVTTPAASLHFHQKHLLCCCMVDSATGDDEPIHFMPISVVCAGVKWS